MDVMELREIHAASVPEGEALRFALPFTMSKSHDHTYHTTADHCRAAAVRCAGPGFTQM